MLLSALGQTISLLSFIVTLDKYPIYSKLGIQVHVQLEFLFYVKTIFVCAKKLYYAFLFA